MKPVFISIWFSLYCACAVAQDYPRQAIDPSQWADELFANQTDNLNYADLYENYLQLLAHPLDLNKATAEQLNSLQVLSPVQVNALMAYREEVGQLYSIYELQTIDAISKEVFLKLVPFVRVVDEQTSGGYRSLWKRLISEDNNYLVMRYSQTLEQQKGYLSNSSSSARYLGTPEDLYVRLRVSRPGDFSTGITLKKDAGEKLEWSPAERYYGFDYVTVHAQVQNKRAIKNLIIGDYQAQFGQGLMLGSVFGIGKNGETITSIRRSNIGFLPYTSQYDGGYMRGAALSYQLHKNILVHTLLSSRNRDGNLAQDTTQSTVSSFNYSGLHRTRNELNNRNALQEQNAAFILSYHNKNVDAGLMLHHTQFDKTLIRNATLYNSFAFQGNANTNVGAYANIALGYISLFGEVAHSLQHGWGGVAGVLAGVTPKLEISMLARHYQRDFYSFYTNALSENSIPQNESGIYWGWKYRFSKRSALAGYMDFFEFPWLKFRNYRPTQGSEWLLRYQYKASRSVTFFAQVREETKARNLTDENNLYQLAAGTRRNFTLQADYVATRQLQLKSRIQFSSFQLNGNATQGLLLAQDATYETMRFSITARYALFDTDDYDNRIYIYEPDTWLAFSFPAYNGKGARHVLVLRYNITKKINCWLRWAQTRYLNQETIGSGGETIMGNSQNDVRFQVRIQF
ncbi:MAG: helix-hairpin-helix domain-containing protein [Cyclobacteriaceae bacterium]|nr:helix-hairpin-helix domain-containing protein [Cyclobacteriaceae bacterium]